MKEKGLIIGGGASPLNFRIIGAVAQPSITKENAVWVNTDQKITGWVIGTQEPETPTEGMVWIKAGNKSTLLMNLLRKNKISLYPIAVKQYLAGEWVSKETHVYTQGEWVLITADIYFVKDGVLTNETSDMKVVSYSGQAPSCYQTENGYHTGMPAWDGGTWTDGAYWFPDPIDLTNYKLVSGLTNVFNAAGGSNVSLFVSKYEPGSGGTNAVASVLICSLGGNTNSNFSFSLDVSALSGAHYIGFHSSSKGLRMYLKEVVIVGND